MTWPRRATSVAEAATLLVATPTSTAVFPPPTTTTRLPWMWIGRMGRRGGSVAVERHASERHNAQRLPGTCRGRAMQGARWRLCLQVGKTVCQRPTLATEASAKALASTTQGPDGGAFSLTRPSAQSGRSGSLNSPVATTR